jgi:hypothetical protein
MQGAFTLLEVRSDPMTAEKEAATDAVRQVIFATKAGRWDVVAKYASPRLPVEKMKTPEWEAFYSKITSANVSSVELRSDHGILLLVRADVRGYTGTLPDFLVDPTTGLIVRAFFRSPENIFTHVPNPDGFTDPDIEAYTLKRFGLTSAP